MMNLLEVDPNSKWIIDTDPGVDDSFAIILAIQTIKNNLVGLSIEAGNTGLNNCFTNACKISAICDKFYPVYKGTLQCLSSNKGKNAEGIHGKDGLYEISDFSRYFDKYENLKSMTDGYIESNNTLFSDFSPFKIIELSHKYSPINLLCLGPLTNLALAFMIDPSLPNRIKKLVIMGGSFRARGNLQPCVEFNFYFDPIAAKIVITNFENIIIYPWETNEIHRLMLSDIDDVEKENDRLKFCKICINNKLSVIQNNTHDSEKGADFPDYGAAIVAFIPNSVKKYSIVYADIIIDSNPEVNGSLLTSQSINSLKGKKIILIEELHQDIFVNCFKSMIK